MIIDSDATDKTTTVRIRLLLEDSPLSDTYTIKTELEAPIVNGSATFYLEQIFLDELLSLTPPEGGGAIGTDGNICKRWKLEMYEYTPADLELVAEAYHEGAVDVYVTIEALENGEDYLIVLETTDDGELDDVELKVGGNTQEPTAHKIYPDEVWRRALNATHDFDSIKLPGFVKANIYKIIANAGYVGTETDVRYTVLGGGLNLMEA